MRHVYIVGSKGIPARYGGFETFVDKLTEYQVSKEIMYHVASLRNNTEDSENHDTFTYNDAEVYSVDVPEIGAAKAIVYDIKALEYAIDDAKQKGYEKPVFYVLASRIGPFIGRLKKKIAELGGSLFLNPDGNEWKRAKWSMPVRKYWKYSEYGMVKHADLIIADNPKIEEYIQSEYPKIYRETQFIAYGTDQSLSTLNEKDSKVRNWYDEKGVLENRYYLIVGRFVPENNYETMIREFMASNSDKDLVIVSNVEKNQFYNDLISKTHFDIDSRIKFVGTMYDQDLLKYIRQNAFAYIHGHEVGGTNPSLLEALATTPVNLLVDVGFNEAVASSAALYWDKNHGSLAKMVDDLERTNQEYRNKLGSLARNVIRENFTWEIIVDKYEKVFLNYGEI